MRGPGVRKRTEERERRRAAERAGRRAGLVAAEYAYRIGGRSRRPASDAASTATAAAVVAAAEKAEGGWRQMIFDRLIPMMLIATTAVLVWFGRWELLAVLAAIMWAGVMPYVKAGDRASWTAL